MLGAKSDHVRPCLWRCLEFGVTARYARYARATRTVQYSTASLYIILLSLASVWMITWTHYGVPILPDSAFNTLVKDIISSFALNKVLEQKALIRLDIKLCTHTWITIFGLLCNIYCNNASIARILAFGRRIFINIGSTITISNAYLILIILRLYHTYVTLTSVRDILRVAAEHSSLLHYGAPRLLKLRNRGSLKRLRLRGALQG